jgi:hypothetical protein
MDRNISAGHLLNAQVRTAAVIEEFSTKMGIVPKKLAHSAWTTDRARIILISS